MDDRGDELGDVGAADEDVAVVGGLGRRGVDDEKGLGYYGGVGRC